ncbi:MAG: KamA family radical SAM protein [Candidatus Omnitrophica bacterium]|jgi:lysine 2,3-aminomutase|nr:KamA family radical SAM protein [Candidatus Omnitrophota bacterium]MDD5079970.1 KamA family radical SAM protein [Candidatus Omnitrophota bacterium]
MGNAAVTENQKMQTENILPVTRPGRKSRDYQQISLYKDVNPLDWEDWHWQMKNRITRLEQISQVIRLTPAEEEGLKNAKGRMAMAVTPYWATLIDPDDPNCPIRRQCIPTASEFKIGPYEMTDPCGEDNDSPAPHLVHRYPDRVLLLATDACAMYCRHCTRRRLVGNEEQPDNSGSRWDKAIEYIRSNKKVRDVLISGGDPLTLEDEVLGELLRKLRAIPHLEFLRLGTRVPVTLPQRITEGLIATLKKSAPVWMSIHFNHPKEITRRTRIACDMLSESGIPLGSQTVLLQGINDRPSTMRKLMHDLLRIRVRPYYIYQCDLVRGTQHFRTPVSAGINIIEKLRGHTSGYGVPTYVIDAPGGGGKIPISPNYILSQAKGKYVLRNYEGTVYTYLE